MDSIFMIQSIIYATGQADQKQSWQLSQPPILIKFLDLHSGHSSKFPAIHIIGYFVYISMISDNLVLCGFFFEVSSSGFLFQKVNANLHLCRPNYILVELQVPLLNISLPLENPLDG